MSEYEFMNEPFTDMLDLSVTGYQAIKFELDLVRAIQVHNTFLLVRYQHTLKQIQLIITITI